MEASLPELSTGSGPAHQAARPDDATTFWPTNDGGPYPYELYDADVTDGPKKDALDGGGGAEYYGIPAGTYLEVYAVLRLGGGSTKALTRSSECGVDNGPSQAETTGIKVELLIQKPTLTLQHDNKTKLKIKVTPDDGNAGNFHIELKRERAVVRGSRSLGRRKWSRGSLVSRENSRFEELR